MIIVGLTGGIGHGKTSFAQFLAANAPGHHHWESSEVIAEVANGLRQASPGSPPADDLAAINLWLRALPAVLMASVHLDPAFETIALTPEKVKRNPENFTKLFEYLELMQARPELLGVDITMANKSDYRALLQWLGGYLVKVVSEGIWYDEIVRRIRLSQSSGSQLATVGGVRFPGDAERLRNAGGSIIELQRPSRADQDLEDLTERERNLIKADATVQNDGSLEQLANCAKQVYADLQLRDLQPTYSAASF